MSHFAQYADYYDLLYADKDYHGEARYLSGLLKRFGPAARRVLELGCGTGRHAAELAQLGYGVHGIDASAGMLARAATAQGPLSFEQADLRSYRAGRAFDATLACFHVVNYQTADEDLEQAFETAAQNTLPGGLFLFDSWYGPAVLAQRPEVRVKRCGSAELEVTRFAEPTLNTEDNLVTVRYTLWVRDLRSGSLEVFGEEHRVRYLFTPEIRRLCARAGLRLLHSEEWLSARPPGVDTWGVCYAASRS
jgi:SAM-dependent methyltransferase